MESDPEGQNSTNIGNSTADHEITPSIIFLKRYGIIAFRCICSLPGPAIALNSFYGGSVSARPLLLICLVSLSPYVTMLNLCFSGSWPFLKQYSSESIAGIYKKTWTTLSTYGIGGAFSAASRLVARTGLLLVWWLAVYVYVLKFKRAKLLGLALWKWNLVACTVPAAYIGALVIVANALVPITAISNRMKGGNSYVYYGLFGNTVLVLCVGAILVVWLGFFRTESGLKHASVPHLEAILDQVTWICISLFVGSVLLFLKTLIVLVWSAKAIYRRFKPRILMTSVKFFYLGLIIGDFFLPRVIREMELVEEHARHSASQNHSFHKYIISKHAGDTYLDLLSQQLTTLAKAVKPLEEDGLPMLLDYFNQNIPRTTNTCLPVDLLGLIACPGVSDEQLKRIKMYRKYHIHGMYCCLFPLIRRIFRNRPASNQQTAENRVIHIDPDDLSPEEYRNYIANVLHCVVREQFPSASENHITFDDLKRWMVDAHLNCVNMGRTLADAAAIVKRLDMIISIIISALVVLMWLLISGIATTKVLVAIGGPFLSLSFMFGESSKIFFQGIIFCFGTHFFDVGDRCFLDSTELEVKRMGIMTTIFLKIETGERIMYPNAVLATKAIINKGWQPDPSDTVELILDMSTFKTEWEALESKLERFFGDDQHRGEFQSWHEVTVKEIADKIKVIIHFKHVLNVKEMTHSQCFQKKKRQRPIILKILSQILGNSATPVNSPAVPTDDLGQPTNTRERLWNGLR